MPIKRTIKRLRETQDKDEKNLRRSIGIFLILVGIAGLFLPFLQGILFITIGYLVLTRPDWKKLVIKHYDKYQKKKKK